MPVVLSAKARRFLGIQKQISQFQQVIPKHEDAAASRATLVSRDRFLSQLSGRPLAPARTGRPTTGGRFADDIIWERDGHGGIELDVPRLQAVAPYFLIQEIGTNKTANILNGAGSSGPGSISVRGQAGRSIAWTLFWASGAGSNAVQATTGATGDQLYLAPDININTMVAKRRKRIRREIKGKHYLRDGGAAGFSELEVLLLTDAQRIFR